jgi:hypothetical protein
MLRRQAGNDKKKNVVPRSPGWKLKLGVTCPQDQPPRVGRGDVEGAILKIEMPQ